MENCALLSRELDEPLSATAPVTPGWLLLEHPGPWAAKAFGASRGLAGGLGAAIEERAKRAGFRATLIRRTTARAESDEGSSVFLAWTEPGATWLRRLRVPGPEALLALDLTALAGPVEPKIGEPCKGPLVLVCTNGKRDRCCAVEGRPLATALAVSHPEATWEASHLGGHRFAPTAVVLPDGYLYGRLDVATARAVADAAARGDMVPGPCRGRATWSRQGQAAELAVRAACGEVRADALRVHAPAAAGDDAWTVRVEHVDGRAWTMSVQAIPEVPARPESCGKGLGNPTGMRAVPIPDGQ